MRIALPRERDGLVWTRSATGVLPATRPTSGMHPAEHGLAASGGGPATGLIPGSRR